MYREVRHMAAKEAEHTECVICGRDDFASGHELVDHMADAHDAFMKLIEGEYHE